MIALQTSSLGRVNDNEVRTRIANGVGVRIVVAVALGIAIRPALAASPYYLGDYPVGHRTYELTDDDRAGRKLRLDVWYPAADADEPLSRYPTGSSRVAHEAAPLAAGTSRPLIVYSHGHGMTSTGNTVYPESLASHGFIVAAPNHTGNTAGDMSSGERSTVERPADVSFVIDTMFAKSADPADGFAGTVDADKVGVSGFSFGGFTTLATVTGVTQGGVTVPPDPRVKAILPIARGSVYAEPIYPSSVTVPTLSIVGEDDGATYGQVTGDLGRISAQDKFLAVLVGAEHVDVGTSYCQQSPEGRACPNDLELATIGQYGVAFFNRYLEGDTSFDSILTAQYAAANFPKVEFWQQALVDINNDGRATLTEFGPLKENFGATGALANYRRGDFNRDRRINVADFGLLKLNFTGPATAAVPEPSGAALALAASLMLLLTRGRRGRAFALLAAFPLTTSTAMADIFRWDNMQLIPGTERITPGPEIRLDGWNRDDHNLRYADLTGINLSRGHLQRSWLDNARFIGANLNYAVFDGAVLRGANLTDAEIQSAEFSNTTSLGFTKEQLYSTHSYKSKRLIALDLAGDNNLSGWYFSGQDLSGAYFSGATLANADFSNALVKNASFDNVTEGGFSALQLYSTQSYIDGDLDGLNLDDNDLSGWNFSGQVLAGARFVGANVTGAEFVDATIDRVVLSGATWKGFTKDQLYSTASYKNHSLGAIDLGPRVVGYEQFVGNDLSEWNLSGQNLSDANLELADLSRAELSQADLTYARLREARLQGADLSDSEMQSASLGAASLIDANLARADLYESQLPLATLANANLEGATFTGADLRGVDLRGTVGFTADGTGSTGNMIWPDGHIAGLTRIDANQSLIVRNHLGAPEHNVPPVPIRVQTGMNMTGATRIELRLDEHSWRSTISFEPGIPVTLDDNALWLQFTSYDAAIRQVGQTFKLFDWTGVSPAGEFRVAQVQGFVDATGQWPFGIRVLYDWDLSQLYTSGEVTLLSAGGVIAGDANSDGRVDLNDFGILKDHVGVAGGRSQGDANGDGRVDLADFALFKTNFGKAVQAVAVPEPASCVLALFGVGMLTVRCRRRRLVRLLPTALLALAVPCLAEAQVYRWDNGRVIPGTEGITPGPGAQFSNWDSDGKNLRYADFSGRDLESASFRESLLDDAMFVKANLKRADLSFSTLTGVDLSGAVVREANFENTGLTQDQLAQSASYHTRDLQGLVLRHNDLSGWNFSGQDLSSADLGGTILTGADLQGANLADASLSPANLTNVELSGANLSGASLRFSTLASTRLSGATVSGADLSGTTRYGLTESQLAATASYQSKDLQGIGLSSNNLSGWDLSGQNLANANLKNTTLVGANLSNGSLASANLTFSNARTAGLLAADLTGAQLDFATLTGADLSGATLVGARLNYSTLMGANLSSANLTGADLYGSRLADADLNGAIVKGAALEGATAGGFTLAQMVSTASYKAKDLSGIVLTENDLSGWNFSSQNLTEAHFEYSNLTNATLEGAIVRGTRFGGDPNRALLTQQQLYTTASYQARDLRDIGLTECDLAGWEFSGQDLRRADFTGANLIGVNFSGADLRGASIFDVVGADSHNAILPDGRIAGLIVASDERIVVRGMDRLPDSFGGHPILIEDRLELSKGGVLELRLDAFPWGAPVFFNPGIPVNLKGTLDLTFAKGADPASQVGHTLHLFDWAGVSPTGAFTVSSLYDWDLSQLYTTGEVTLLAAGGAIAGDATGDGKVDVADFAILEANFGSGSTLAEGDFDGNGQVDLADFGILKANFGTSGGAAAVPEPGGLALALGAAVGLINAAAHHRRVAAPRWVG